MTELIIKIDDQVYNNFIRNEYSRADVMAIHAALVNATPLQTGRWIDKDEKSAVCSCCNRNNTLYGDFCKWCGAKMVEPQESKSKRYAELAKHYVQGLRAGLAESEDN